MSNVVDFESRASRSGRRVLDAMPAALAAVPSWAEPVTPDNLFADYGEVSVAYESREFGAGLLSAHVTQGAGVLPDGTIYFSEEPSYTVALNMDGLQDTSRLRDAAARLLALADFAEGVLPNGGRR